MRRMWVGSEAAVNRQTSAAWRGSSDRADAGAVGSDGGFHFLAPDIGAHEGAFETRVQAALG